MNTRCQPWFLWAPLGGSVLCLSGHLNLPGSSLPIILSARWPGSICFGYPSISLPGPIHLVSPACLVSVTLPITHTESPSWSPTLQAPQWQWTSRVGPSLFLLTEKSSLNIRICFPGAKLIPCHPASSPFPRDPPALSSLGPRASTWGIWSGSHASCQKCPSGPRGNHQTRAWRCVYKAVHCRIVCNRKGLETAQMSNSGGWLNELWSSHTMENQAALKKWWGRCIFIEMARHSQYIIKWKKSRLQRHI